MKKLPHKIETYKPFTTDSCLPQLRYVDNHGKPFYGMMNVVGYLYDHDDAAAIVELWNAEFDRQNPKT